MHITLTKHELAAGDGCARGVSRRVAARGAEGGSDLKQFEKSFVGEGDTH
tara:strand:+ start:329 stop:478 length:150 start_codon:yes stop_codon:yes gene_type:complete